jgi:hypothetical protein
MASNDVWVIDPENMTREWMGQTEKILRLRLLALFQRYRAQIEQFMKSNAAWTDRTGNLRQTLYAEIEEKPYELILRFDYGLDYGKYLEFRFDLADRFAIVNPAFDVFAPKFLADANAIMHDL